MKEISDTPGVSRVHIFTIQGARIILGFHGGNSYDSHYDHDEKSYMDKIHLDITQHFCLWSI